MPCSGGRWSAAKSPLYCGGFWSFFQRLQVGGDLWCYGHELLPIFRCEKDARTGIPVHRTVDFVRAEDPISDLDVSTVVPEITDRSAELLLRRTRKRDLKEEFSIEIIHGRHVRSSVCSG